MLGQRAPFCGGDGTTGNPYQVCDAGSLQYVARHLTSHYKLTQDIAASATVGWNANQGFKPVGDCGVDNVRYTSDDVNFQGSVDGQGFAISDLTISRSAQNCVGLFGKMGLGGAIQNLNLSRVAIAGRDSTGGLLGGADADSGAVTLSKVSVDGTVSGRQSVGGIVGTAAADLFSIADSSAAVVVSASDRMAAGLVADLSGYNNCILCTVLRNRTSGKVTGAGDYVGGLIGYAFRGTVTECGSSAEISGKDFVGGLSGYTEAVTQARLFATGKVTGHNYVGGLNGYTELSTLSDAYATGAVTGNQYVAAVQGGELGPLTLSRVYGTGALTASLNPGGIVGESDAITRSALYWDSQTTGQTFGLGNSGVATVANQYESKTTAQMQQQSTFVTWDFSTVWIMPTTGGYPVLRWAQ